MNKTSNPVILNLFQNLLFVNYLDAEIILKQVQHRIQHDSFLRFHLKLYFRICQSSVTAIKYNVTGGMQ